VSHGDQVAKPPAEELAASIDTSIINKQRRYFLIGATAVVGAVGIVGAAIPFVASWSPSAKARALGAPATIDISKLQQGELLGPTPAWRGQPIFVLSRPADVVERLKQPNDNLADPESANPDMQPAFAQNAWRSQRPEIGIYVGLCTHLGCIVQREGEAGFFCPCHGSRFDGAGRPIAGPAPGPLHYLLLQVSADGQLVVDKQQQSAADVRLQVSL